jgi:hypothetical protein
MTAAPSKIELLEDFLLDPPRAAEDVRRKPPLFTGLLSFVLGGLSVALAFAVLQKGGAFGGVWPAAALTCLWHVFSGAVMTALLHLIADAAGGEGRASSLFVLLGLSNLGWTLILPAALLSRALLPGSVWPFSLMFLFAGGLTFLLRVRSVRDNYGIGIGRAWLAVLLPYAALFALAFLALALAMWGLAVQVVKAVS